MKFQNHKNEIERQIIVPLVEDLFKAGYLVGVNDGEETTLKPQGDEASVFAAMSTTDEDFLLVKGNGISGWIRLIYGNGGWDVVSDYTCNIEDKTPEVFTRSNAVSERFSG